MKQITMPLIIAIFSCFLTASNSSAEISPLLENYAVVADATWQQPFTNIYQMGLETSSGRIILESASPWGDNNNMDMLAEHLILSELSGYAVPFIKNGPFDVSESYIFFDKTNSIWKNIGTITPKNGRTYVIFIPKPEVSSDSTTSSE